MHPMPHRARMAFLGFPLGIGVAALSLAAQVPTPLFRDSDDVGHPGKAGKVLVDRPAGRYSVSGGGANMWSTNDAFHFVWTQASGDVSLAANIQFPEPGGDPHRKACLMIRQSLDPDSAYADVALHGDGLTSLQYRPAQGDRTYEIQSGQSKPQRLRIERRGHYMSMSLAGADKGLEPAGGSFRLMLREPFYVGLAVCAHNDQRIETAVFTQVEFTKLDPLGAGARRLSTLETVPIGSKDRRVVHVTTNHIEAPNWSRDGKEIVFNGGGRLYRIPATGGAPAPINTGAAIRCNNDHGFSPDGQWLAISDQSTPDRKSRVHILPAQGGTPRLITPSAPSYWHGWSPDGNTLAYCAQRDGNFDIYTIPVAGGAETRITQAPGLDDGPDYTADGRFIYFNSDRSGTMQIWRMGPDGSHPEAVTTEDYPSWFPHPSPDGKWLVFLSYEKGVEGHPEDRDVTLHLMPLGGGKIEVLAKLFGGQGTLNVPSWSPDSKRVAFVSYQRVP